MAHLTQAQRNERNELRRLQNAARQRDASLSKTRDPNCKHRYCLQRGGAPNNVVYFETPEEAWAELRMMPVTA
jgi:hypothetical protein